MMANRTSLIETHTGGFFDYYDPQPANVELGDIARALSLQCRFNGLIERFYSVAEHACLVYELVVDGGWPSAVCYAALHHDSHEAYLGDVPSPLKRTFGPSWKRMETRVDAAIAAKLGIDPELFHHEAVKAADQKALLMEAAVLKPSKGVGPHWNNDTVADHDDRVECLYPSEAEELFLDYHDRAVLAAQ